MPNEIHTPRSGGTRRTGRLLARAAGAAAALIVVVLLGVTVWTAPPGTPGATPATPSPSRSSSGPHFDGSGVHFDYPSTWHLEPVTQPSSAAADLVAAFGRGLPPCASPAPGAATPTGGIGDQCPFTLPLAPDSMSIMVALAEGIGTSQAAGTPLTIAGQPAWYTAFSPAPNGGDAILDWTVTLPTRQHDSLVVAAFVRGPDLASMRAEVDAMLASLRLDPPPTPVASIGADDARYPTGIPRVVDGQPVHVGLDAIVYGRATSDATPFLVGGWFTAGSTQECSGGIGPRSPLLSGCGTVVGGDAPWAMSAWPGPQGQIYWGTHLLPDDSGPAVVRVHTHDPRAQDCASMSPETVPVCEAVLVVDDVVWTGDRATRTGPHTVQEAADRLGEIAISAPLTSGATPIVPRGLILTAPQASCGSPWPAATFVIHGDPRFGLLAVFPDAASRQRFQDSTAPTSVNGCPLDPNVARPGPGTWVADQNALVLVFDAAAAHATAAALAAPTFMGSPKQPLTTLPASFDQAYATVADFEASRQAGVLDPAWQMLWAPPDDDRFVLDAYRRQEADGLDYVIGPGRPVQAGDVPAPVWARLQRAAQPGTARLFTVSHPHATDPALATEVLIAAAPRSNDNGWGLLLVSAAPYPTTAP